MTFRELVEINKDILKEIDGNWVTPSYKPFFEDDKRYMLANATYEEPVFDEDLNEFFSPDAELVLLYNYGEEIVIDDMNNLKELKVYVGE